MTGKNERTVLKGIGSQCTKVKIAKARIWGSKRDMNFHAQLFRQCAAELHLYTQRFERDITSFEEVVSLSRGTNSRTIWAMSGLKILDYKLWACGFSSPNLTF